MSKSEKDIRDYLHRTFYGCEITKETFNGLAQHIIESKIVDSTDIEYIKKLINKYAVYSKKKDTYYFITNNIIKLKHLPPPK